MPVLQFSEHNQMRGQHVPLDLQKYTWLICCLKMTYVSTLTLELSRVIAILAKKRSLPVGDQIDGVAHVVLQDPVEDIALVLAELDLSPAQDEDGVGVGATLGGDVGPGLRVHLLWLLCPVRG